jgi:chemotaxis protein MotB
MARKKEPEKAPNHERWLVSYADFITLLFAVFVVLYSMSQTDKQKVEALIQSLRESFGYTKTSTPAQQLNMLESSDISPIPSLKPEIVNPGPRASAGKGKSRAEEKDFREIKTSIDAYLLKHGAQEKVSTEISKRGLVISLKEAGFFDSGKSIVKEISFPLLGKIAQSVGQYSNPIRVEGHTDNDPIHSAAFPSNWELSTSRATNIVHYLIDHYQFEPSRISAAGYGEYRPVAENSTSEGKGKNRRVDIVMLSSESEQQEP